MSEDRAAALGRLLSETGFGDAVRRPMAGDASTRRYERLSGARGRAILMDAPPSTESPPCPPAASEAERLSLGWNAVSRLAASRVEAFVAVADYLRGLGLSAPVILGVDAAHGFAIVEDLGDALYARVIEDGADEVALYEAAAEALAVVHRSPPPSALAAPGAAWPLLEFDALALRANADLFVEWMPRHVPEIRIGPAELAQWTELRDGLVAEAMGFERAFTLRDYHAENLVWLPDRAGPARVGLLDIQDAVRGWPAWDFAMLLQDARRDVRQPAAEAAVRRYLELSGMNRETFFRQLAVLGALNALRILGIFARLVERDGKPRYAGFMPREWGHLARNLRHPELGALNGFVRAVARPFVENAE